MSLWLICIAIEPIVFYGIDWPIPAERVIKIRLKKQLAAECPAIKISLFKRLLFLSFFLPITWLFYFTVLLSLCVSLTVSLSSPFHLPAVCLASPQLIQVNELDLVTVFVLLVQLLWNYLTINATCCVAQAVQKVCVSVFLLSEILGF